MPRLSGGERPASDTTRAKIHQIGFGASYASLGVVAIGKLGFC
jgi:hypothetical protein